MVKRESRISLGKPPAKDPPERVRPIKKPEGRMRVHSETLGPERHESFIDAVDRVPPMKHKRYDDGPSLAELQRGIRIDPNDLEDANIQQAELYWRVADRVAILTDERDTLRQTLAEEEAAEDLKVRARTPEDEKVREKDVASQVMRAPRIVALRGELQRASAELGRWSALEKAYGHRLSALKRLVDLWLQKNYGGVARREQDAAVERVRDARRNNQKEL